jgi:Ser/Thr protein kinase RdoA (MazF antagonist)
MFGAAPCLDEATMRSVLEECFGIVDATVLEPLPSERDQNVRVTVGGDRRLVLKVNELEGVARGRGSDQRCQVANEREDRAHLEAQCAMLQRLEVLDACPRAVGPALATSSRCPHNLLRLVTYAEGKPLATMKEGLDAAFFVRLGKLVGSMDILLRAYDHPALHRPGMV